MNKLWLFFYIMLGTLSNTFFLSAYDQGIRKERAHRKSYRTQINTLQQEIASQQAQSVKDKEIVANLEEENYSLKQDNQKILSALNADNVDKALKKINHLLFVQKHSKDLSKKVHAMTKMKKIT